MKTLMRYPLVSVLFWLFFLFVIFAAVAPAFALQGEVTPVDPLVALRVVDMALMLPIMAFIKEHFGIKGNLLLFVGFVVWCVLFFTPEISKAWEYFPLVVACIKGFLGSVGTYDLGVDIQKKTEQIKATQGRG